jgi:iron complex transport system permease protein
MGEPHVGASAGALLSMAVVFIASRRRSGIDPLSMLLVGVVISTINGALIMAVNHLAGPGGLRDDLARWMMGNLNGSVSGTTVTLLAATTVAGWAVLRVQSKAMDIASLSDEEAMSLGVHAGRLRTAEFLVAGLLSAGAVVLAGPVAFVGLIAPHVGRVLLGSLHGPLLLASAMVGVMLVVGSDTAGALVAVLSSRMGQSVGLMPLGVFTAILGGVSFLWLLRRSVDRLH